MPSISFSFEFNEPKADEPLGSVLISEDNNQIRADTVYFDTFFSTLVSAYCQSANGPVSLEVPDEREAIRAERTERGLKLAYGEKEIWFSDAAEFGRCLKQTCADLLDSFPAGTTNGAFDAVRRFVSQGP